jgi:hypothetical protein
MRSSIFIKQLSFVGKFKVLRITLNYGLRLLEISYHYFVFSRNPNLLCGQVTSYFFFFGYDHFYRKYEQSNDKTTFFLSFLFFK